MEMSQLLNISGLDVSFPSYFGSTYAVRDVSIVLNPGEVLGIVGESGAGKSTIGNAIIKLLEPPGEIANGEIVFQGQNICKLDDNEMRSIRGQKIGMIFQDPQTSLNPLMTIGSQLLETVINTTDLVGKPALKKAIDLLEAVGIEQPELRFKAYPHQFSGGKRQRVVIALALAGDPDLIIADEPTTALDVSIQAQILDLIKALCRERRLGVIIITHDIGVIANIADRVAVMYDGSVVETGEVRKILTTPEHEYTKSLIAAVPRGDMKLDRFSSVDYIEGGQEEHKRIDLDSHWLGRKLNQGSSKVAISIEGLNKEFIINMGQKVGMTNVGIEKNEVLSVDKNIFIKELKQLMNCYEQLDQFTFFKLVHSAYDKTIGDYNKKSLTFYHIHNPDLYAQFNFLRLAPNVNWLMMVREPIQNCESWIRKNFNNNNHRKIANKIFQMLFDIDHVIYRNDNSIGVRLEDLKENPKKTIPALCNWLGIRENDSLYEMTAQGKKWWGDPSSPDYKKEGMSPFGKTSISRKLGLVFSENDQFILRTLFYPFCVRFGYVEENLEQFRKDLKTIRPMIDQMFDFEKKIAQNKKVDTEKFMKSGPYLYLRSGIIERWNTLNKFHTYPNMITHLKIN